MVVPFLFSMWESFLHIVSAPFKDLSVLWQLAPLFLMWIVLEVYFGRWREDLGWNSALANAITLFWIVVSMLQIVFGKDGMFSWLKLIVMLVALLYSLFLCVVVFKHGFKDKVVFFIASPPLIYYLSFIVIIWGHGLLEFSWMVLFVVFLLYWVVFGIDKLVKHFIPDSNHPDNKKDDFKNDVKSVFKDDSMDFGKTDAFGSDLGTPKDDRSVRDSGLSSSTKSAPASSLQSTSAPPGRPFARPGLRRRRSSPFH